LQSQIWHCYAVQTAVPQILDFVCFGQLVAVCSLLVSAL